MNYIVQIFRDMFHFQTEDIRRLFAKNGVEICAEETQRLYELTGGWAAEQPSAFAWFCHQSEP